jgi:hypothetical protein
MLTFLICLWAVSAVTSSWIAWKAGAFRAPLDSETAAVVALCLFPPVNTLLVFLYIAGRFYGDHD